MSCRFAKIGYRLEFNILVWISLANFHVPSKVPSSPRTMLSQKYGIYAVTRLKQM